MYKIKQVNSSRWTNPDDPFPIIDYTIKDINNDKKKSRSNSFEILSNSKMNKNVNGKALKEYQMLIDIVDEFEFDSITDGYRRNINNVTMIVKSKKTIAATNYAFAQFTTYLQNLQDALVKTTFPLYEKINQSFDFYLNQFDEFIQKVKRHPDKRGILENFYVFLHLYMFHLHNINHVFYHNDMKIVKDNFGIALFIDIDDSHKPKLICAIDAKKLHLLKMLLINTNDKHFYNPELTSDNLKTHVYFDDKLLIANLIIVHLLERLIQSDLTAFFHNFRHEQYYFASQFIAETSNIDINNFIV